MPLYVADYETRAPIIMHAASPEHALAMLEAINEEPPRLFHEVPEGIFMAELYVEDEESQVEHYSESDIIPNPANHSQVGYVFEPLEGLADWVTLMLKTSDEAPPATDAERDASFVADIDARSEEPDE